MPMFRAGLAVAAMLIGGISAFLGMVVTLGALKTGSVSISYETGSGAVTETVTQAADAARYWLLVSGLGIVPAVLGSIAALWGWRSINR
jgi:hypothetical protein